MSRAFLLLFFFLFLSFSGYSQHPVPYSVKHYTDNNGLPQNSVKSVVKDDLGFLWLATEAGLVRFDGSNFLLYEKDATHASTNRMYTIVKVLKTGKLYAETEYHEFIPISGGYAVPKPAHKALKMEREDIEVAHELPLKNPHLQDFTMQIAADENCTVLKDSLVFHKRGKNNRIAFPHQKEGSFFISGKQVIYSNNKGAFTLFKDAIPQPIPLTGDFEQERSSKNPNFKIYWGNSTDQAFLYLNKTLYRLEYKDGKLLTKLIINDFDFEEQHINNVYYDSINKRLFLGSFSQGLFVLQLQLFNTSVLHKKMDNKVSYAQLPFGDHTVLFANGTLLNTDGISRQLPLFDTYSNNFSLATDRDKNIWTQNGMSVYKLNPKGNKLLQTFNFPDQPACLYLDQDSVLWIGTRGGIYTAPTGRQDSIPTLVVPLKNVTYIKKKGDELWIGTFKGLYKYHLRKKNLFAVPQMANANVRSILIRNEEIWISTYGDGFYLYKNHQLTKMPLDDHKYLNHAHCLIADKKGFLWISTNKGLFQVAVNDLLTVSKNNLAKVYYAYYDKTSGFKTDEFNGGCQPCGSVLNNGIFVFPSLIGSVLFNPLTISPELPDKPIYIDKITVDNTEILKKDTLSIGQDFERLEVQVSSPYFGTAYNLQFEYRLSANGSWLKLTEKAIVFSKLQHGTYELYIRKLNGFNSKFTFRKLTIIVRPYFYQTWWFYSIISVLIVAGLIFFIKARTRSILLKNERLENLIRKRTQDLEKNIIILEESKYLLSEQTSFQKKLIAAITHDLKSPLKYMMVMGKHLYKNESVSGPVKDNLMAIYTSANSMYHFTENLLNYSKLFHTKKPSKDDYVNLNQLIAEKIEIFSGIAKYSRTTLHNHISSDIILYTNRVMLSVIIHNLLDNAIKFCADGRIEFGAKSTDQYVSFWIQDTGYGMPEAILNWLNSNSEERSEENQDLTDGLGLKMVKVFTAKMDLQLTVKSEAGQGTKIEFKLLNHQSSCSFPPE
ncbi:Signal transduction histidine kinase [Pedobacter steynii]|uniref:histidine kinase n=1 Tax=Pedobacter steynii TaxID=430522 RepID=A0A1G9PIF6_9SPHI|nr:ATP-binding protein [Pedobacter steynii]NQX38989.1 hypothetical protein [Pedobacter steynii]SDL97915.1 Signal transduction histidine kinase [Pedobacter steynii]